MRIIELENFFKSLTKDIVEQKLTDIEADTKGQIVYKGIWRTLRDAPGTAAVWQPAAA